MITSRVIDNDVNGTTGIGTIYEITVSNKDATHTVTYGLLDIINCKFDLAAYIKEHHQVEVDVPKERVIRSAKSVHAEIDAFVVSLLLTNATVVAQYKNGNVKSINSLIGQVMKKYPNVDALGVRNYIVDKMKD